MTPEELTLVVGAVTAGAGGTVTAFATWRKYRLDKRESESDRDEKRALESGNAGVSLQKGQQDFIATLQRENENWRRQVEELHRLVDQLRSEIEELRHELAAERRARESGEARTVAEGATRTRLGNSTVADEREITASGDAAEQRYEDNTPDFD